jgi:TonB family C-terminal domain
MTSTDILKANLLDIVFENRNKQYGAYILRKYYSSRLTIALLTPLSVTFLAFFIFRNSGTIKAFRGKLNDGVIIETVHIPKDPPKPIPPPRQKLPHVAQTQLGNLTIKKDPEVHMKMPDLSVFENSVVSNHTEVGIVPLTSSSPTTLTTETSKPSTNEEKPFEPVERAPEFPGGMKAWVNFLSKNLETPSQLEAGEKKTVMIRFKVYTDGSITDFEIVQSAGSVYDNEVIRVLKKMPKWKPAIQNGHIVATSFTQPVTFVGVEQ